MIDRRFRVYVNGTKEREGNILKTNILPLRLRAGIHQKWLTTITVGTGVFLATLDSSIVNVSLPTMVGALQTNFTIIQWVVLSYLLTVTTLMLGFGRLGDIVGKKCIYFAGFAIFTLASAMCGFSSHVYFLVASRVIQGVGAAMIMALGAAIMTEAFPPAERGKAMGIIGATVSIGIVTGPALGGIIVDLLSWNWIFFVNLPTGMVGVWMVWRFIPENVPAHRQKFDYLGAIILFVALTCFLIGLSIGQQYGFSHTAVLILLPAALVFLAGFIWVELVIEQPMIQLTLFRNPLLCVNLFTGFIAFIAIGGTFILLPFYLEVILGYTTMKVGMLMCVIPIMMGIFSPISGSLSDRLGTRPITLLGLIVLAGGYLAAGTLSTETDAPGFALRIVGIGLGIGLFLSPNNSAIMGAGPRNQMGVVSGLMAISRTLGQTAGVAIIGAFWAFRVSTLVGNGMVGDVTKAPLALQVAGLQSIFNVVAGMVGVALCVSAAGYILEKRDGDGFGRRLSASVKRGKT